MLTRQTMTSVAEGAAGSKASVTALGGRLTMLAAEATTVSGAST